MSAPSQIIGGPAPTPGRPSSYAYVLDASPIAIISVKQARVSTVFSDLICCLQENASCYLNNHFICILITIWSSICWYLFISLSELYFNDKSSK